MKLHKIIATCFLVAAVALVGIFVLPANAQATTEGYYTYEVSNGEATITVCSPSISGDVTIPSTLGGYPVTSIGSYAFYYCRSLTSITIPGSVTSIGYSAFFWCSSLTSITIPGSVTSIGGEAFSKCSSLESITVAAGNGKYSSDTAGVLFNKDKTSLIQAPSAISGNYIIPNGVTTIGDSAFCECRSLESITIPDSVTSIENFAFSGCRSLTDVYYAADEAKWDQITIGEDNDRLKNATIHYNYGQETTALPDFTGDDQVTDADAVYLLRYTLFPEDYPLIGEGDVNSDGVVTDADAIYLLRYTLFPEDYPLYPKKSDE